jgi:hypothetical protein
MHNNCHCPKPFAVHYPVTTHEQFRSLHLWYSESIRDLAYFPGKKS